MKTIHALGTTVSTLAEVSTTHAAIVTTPAEIDAFYDKAATNCTGVSVFVRIFATCGTERTEDEAVYDEKDASKTMFCVPNRAKYLGEANRTLSSSLTTTPTARRRGGARTRIWRMGNATSTCSVTKATPNSQQLMKTGP